MGIFVYSDMESQPFLESVTVQAKYSIDLY